MRLSLIQQAEVSHASPKMAAAKSSLELLKFPWADSNLHVTAREKKYLFQKWVKVSINITKFFLKVTKLVVEIV